MTQPHIFEMGNVFGQGGCLKTVSPITDSEAGIRIYVWVSGILGGCQRLDHIGSRIISFRQIYLVAFAQERCFTEEYNIVFYRR